MKTISEKAEIAINAINQAISELRSQLKIQRLDKPTADKLVIAARKKAKTAKNAYFDRYPKDIYKQSSELDEADKKGIIDDLIKSYDELNEVGELYFKTIPLIVAKQKQSGIKGLSKYE